MKIFLSVTLSLLFLSGSYANDKYDQAMKKNLEKMGECKTADDYIKVANNFERVALAEKDKWLPYYYGSLNYVIASFTDTISANKDAYLDKADQLAGMADSLDQNNSEIYTLKGMTAQARMSVDPMNRWQKYGAEADKNFTLAIAADSLNPRPEYLIGVGIFHTPEQFGGGPANAKPILEKSLAKFEKFVPANDLMPHWGREEVEQILKQIDEKK